MKSKGGPLNECVLHNTILACSYFCGFKIITVFKTIRKETLRLLRGALVVVQQQHNSNKIHGMVRYTKNQNKQKYVSVFDILTKNQNQQKYVAVLGILTTKTNKNTRKDKIYAQPQPKKNASKC